MPERIQLSRAKGWRMPPNTVKVDRSTPWGNDYVVWRDDEGQWTVSNGGCHWPVSSKIEGNRVAVEKFAAAAEKTAAHYGGATRLLPLRGKNLACWCRLGEPCHADVLLRLANRGGA